MTEDHTKMAMPAAVFEPTISEETTTSKLKRKYKESPFMVFGKSLVPPVVDSEVFLLLR